MPLARAMVALLPKARSDRPKSVLSSKLINNTNPNIARVSATAQRPSFPRPRSGRRKTPSGVKGNGILERPIRRRVIE